MDSTLHCNNSRCRCLCLDEAVVTTCSHIFCIPCAGRLGLTETRDGHRVCPACSTQLVNPDDAVIASLNPPEDYKTSILSGLSPTIIIECAGRGLAFWAYQMVQEITFQEYLARSLTDRYSLLESQRTESERKLKEENDHIHTSLEAVSQEKRDLLNKTEHLQQSLREKNKNMQQLQALYNKLKYQQQAGTLEMAADQGAEDILQHAGSQQQRTSTRNLPGQSQQQQQQQHRAHAREGSNGSGGNHERRQQGQQAYSHHNIGTNSYQSGASYRPGFGTAHSLPVPPGPSTSRQRLPPAYDRPAYGTYNQSLMGGTLGAGVGNPSARTDMSPRGRNGAGNSPINGYGMSSGMRMGRPQAAPLSRVGRGTNRPGGVYSGMTMR